MYKFNFQSSLKFILLRKYFLLLLPIFFVLHGYVQYFNVFSVSNSILLILLYSGIAILASYLFFFFFKDWGKSSILTFLLLSFHFFFGNLLDSLKSLSPYIFFTRYLFLLPFSFLFFVSLSLMLKRARVSFNKLSAYLNFLFLILIAIEIILLINKINNYRVHYENAMTSHVNRCNSCTKPDIYLLLADEYAGDTELKDIFGFDNTSFTKSLEKRGFHVVKNSTGNYNITPFAMASLFSMDYLQSITGTSWDKDDRTSCFNHINRNSFVDFLRQNDYRIHNYSMFRFGDQPAEINSQFFLQDKKGFLAQTFIERVRRDVWFNVGKLLPSPPSLKGLLEYELKNIEAVQGEFVSNLKRESSEPRFFYAHFMMPHHPYYYDANGKRSPLSLLTENEKKEEKYLEYLQYSNAIFLRLIDTILSYSKQPPIILLMSDHGFRNFTGNVDRKYNFSNFNAILLPNRDYREFYDGLSNVNQLRILLNSQFQQKLPLLRDSTIFLRGLNFKEP